MKSFQQNAGLFVQELDSSYRLRFGLYLIVVLFLVWMSLVLSDERSVRDRDFWLMSENQLEFTELEDAGIWQQRLAEQQIRNTELIQGVWVGSSESQLIASIQTATRAMLLDAGLQKYTVELGAPQVFDDERNLRKIRLRIRAEFEENAALAFVSAAEKSTPSLVFERLAIEVVELRGRKNRFNADLVAFLQVTAR